MTRDVFVRHLQQVPLFSACSTRDLQRVARRAEDVKVEAGTELVREGATGHEFFVILSGTAKVVRRGRKVTTLGPGASFGELALLDAAPRDASVVAETPMELALLAQRDFVGLLEEVPGFARKLLAGMARRLREADKRPLQ